MSLKSFLSVAYYIETLSYRNTLYLLYLCLCLSLGLYMSYLCDLFCHYHFHFHYNESYNLTDTDKLVFLGMFVKRSASGCCLAFANFNLSLLIKVLLIKKSVYIRYCIERCIWLAESRNWVVLEAKCRFCIFV